MTDLSISEKIRAGLNECARNQLAIPARERLVEAGFDPPNDPAWFSAALACFHLGVRS